MLEEYICSSKYNIVCQCQSNQSRCYMCLGISMYLEQGKHVDEQKNSSAEKNEMKVIIPSRVKRIPENKIKLQMRQTAYRK